MKKLGVFYLVITLVVTMFCGAFVSNADAKLLNNLDWSSFHAYFWKVEENGNVLTAVKTANMTQQWGALITSGNAVDGLKSYRYETNVQIVSPDGNASREGWDRGRLYIGLNENVGIFGYNNIDQGNTTTEKIPNCIGIEIMPAYDNGTPYIQASVFNNGEAVEWVGNTSLTAAQKDPNHFFNIVADYDAAAQQMKLTVDGVVLATFDNVDSALAGGYFGFEGILVNFNITKTEFTYIESNPQTSDSISFFYAVIVLALAAIVIFKKKPVSER